MDTLSYKTISANRNTVKQEWHIVDARNQVVGRLASQIAMIVRGKHKASFTPHVNCGDKVVVINADKIKFTGTKLGDKQYIRYTVYPGGQRFATPEQLLVTKPEFILEHAVRGMLPNNKLRKEYLKNLFVYAGENHPHAAQNPKTLERK
ncbi:MAG: 50S ribosomal protein L13 [Bacteroidota bacterium]|nr:50S ribosomal protein L13 [Bacteroidota bacterium]